MPTLTVKPGVPFLLKGETCLRAQSPAKVYLPADILVNGKKFSDVVSVSEDDIDIAFQESSKDSRQLSAIIISLRANTWLKVHRATEAMVHADGVATTFDLLDE
jgi:hypothetical protein